MRYVSGMIIALSLLGRVAAGDELLIAGFDKAPIPQSATGVFAIAVDANAPKDPFLRYKAEGKSSVLVNLPIPRDKNLSKFGSLRAKFRAGEAADELRWFAVNADRRVLFQCRVSLPPGQEWQAMTFSFSDWRWGNEFAGDWAEVRTIVLQADSENPAFDLDEVKLAGEALAVDRSMVATAFGEGARVVEKDGLLVATDAVEQITPAQQEAMLRRMGQVRAFLQRVVPDAVRPTRQPAYLLIFAQADAYHQFFVRLGERWKAQIAAPIAAPTEGGYTVQNIATSTWDPAWGAERPAYLHESVHAIVATDCRLNSRAPSQVAIQEGLANYLQLVLYPGSVKAAEIRANFARPIDPTGAGFFKPLNKLLAERVAVRSYLQVATLIGYLVENDPKLLAAWMRAAADGRNADDAMKAAGTTIAELEAKWWEWGTARYTKGRDPAAAHFETPAEFAEWFAK